MLGLVGPFASVEEGLFNFLVVKILMDDGLLTALDEHLLEHVRLDIAFLPDGQLVPVGNLCMIGPKKLKILLIEFLIRRNLLH